MKLECMTPRSSGRSLMRGRQGVRLNEGLRWPFLIEKEPFIEKEPLPGGLLEYPFRVVVQRDLGIGPEHCKTPRLSHSLAHALSVHARTQGALRRSSCSSWPSTPFSLYICVRTLSFYTRAGSNTRAHSYTHWRPHEYTKHKQMHIIHTHTYIYIHI